MAPNLSRPPKQPGPGQHGQHAHGEHGHEHHQHKKHAHVTHRRQGSIWSMITGGIPLHVRLTGGNLGSRENRAVYYKEKFESTMRKLNKDRKFPLSMEQVVKLQAKAAEYRKLHEDIAGKQK